MTKNAPECKICTQSQNFFGLRPPDPDYGAGTQAQSTRLHYRTACIASAIWSDLALTLRWTPSRADDVIARLFYEAPAAAAADAAFCSYCRSACLSSYVTESQVAYR